MALIIVLNYWEFNYGEFVCKLLLKRGISRRCSNTTCINYEYTGRCIISRWYMHQLK